MAYGPIIVPVRCDTPKCRFDRLMVEIPTVSSFLEALQSVNSTAVRAGWEITPGDAALPTVACPDHRLTPLPDTEPDA